MLSNEADLQKEYEYFLKDHLPDGFSYVDDEEPPTVVVTVKNAAETAKKVETELRFQGYSESMVTVTANVDGEHQQIHLSFDLLYFTEQQAKSCLLLVARTIYTFESGSETKEETSIFSFFNSKKRHRKRDEDKFKDDITKEDVVKAVRKFSDNLPDGTYRTILVNDDYSIDLSQLRRFLPRKPTQKYYMSKETYEIFEEHEAHIPPLMDKVQKAVDAYVREHKEYPIIPYDHARRVNGYLLVQEHLLDEMPSMDFYITNYDGLITHTKPKK
ncbi:DUF3939 domain-containing protein [Bacillus sp. DNRA2]|uniref:DUF3939 domain-containing protein n=1 Tax=Bacillus sp. DNRA2 TaxID=2723053 RepID=UPI00145EBFD2|nr:DUF3939 domain-containing protein [Bacillus sp. DNRA2]NMD71440.1 DUF3939 domain-containing protein [Bacillus sp. DNRA2]